MNEKKPQRELYIESSTDRDEPFQLVDKEGNQIRLDRTPERLADYALSVDLCDVVRHRYDLVAYAAVKNAGLVKRKGAR